MWRSDEIATLYLFGPLRRVLPSKRARVPILMYHSVSDAAPEGKHPYYHTVTTPRVFGEQMRYLQEQGFGSVTLAEAVKYLESGICSVRKPVVITFDDGFRDFLTNAFPLLTRYGLSATMFLPTAYIGDVNRVFKGHECLTWSEVRELHRAGVQFGSHTVTHPQLRDLNWPAVESELRASKVAIEDGLGYGVGSFAYPYAFPETDRTFVQRLGLVLREAGYRDGVSTRIGVAGEKDRGFFMKRLPVNSWDDSRFLRAKLAGGYDWLHDVQYVAKLQRKIAG